MNTTNIDYDQDGGVDAVKILYLLYLAAIFAGITAVIGVIMAYVNSSKASDWLLTHYIFLRHTFWKGLMFAVLGFLLLPFVVGYFIWLFLIVWWIVRCVKGIQSLARREAIADPTGWGL